MLLPLTTRGTRPSITGIVLIRHPLGCSEESRSEDCDSQSAEDHKKQIRLSRDFEGRQAWGAIRGALTTPSSRESSHCSNETPPVQSSEGAYERRSEVFYRNWFFFLSLSLSEGIRRRCFCHICSFNCRVPACTVARRRKRGHFLAEREEEGGLMAFRDLLQKYLFSSRPAWKFVVIGGRREQQTAPSCRYRRRLSKSASSSRQKILSWFWEAACSPTRANLLPPVEESRVN